MKVFILLILGIGLLPTVSAVIHSWKAFYTGSTGLGDFPEFVAVNIVDDQLMGYFDSRINRFEAKQSWMEGKLGPEYVEQQTNTLRGHVPTFHNNVRIVMERFNQSKGVHVVQEMYGCQWDEETGVIEGFDQHGYDGEDFISFDLKTLTWIASKSKAFITKNKLDHIPANNKYWKDYLNQTCIEWLKKYVDYGKSSLMRTVPPSVSLLQKTPSSPVTCHATGFYPSGVMVTWKKNGQEQYEDVEVGETLQNDDGTFQKSVHLAVKPEEWKNNKYQCVVQVSGINKDFIKDLTESEIQTNRGENDPTSIGLIIGVVVAGLLAIIAAVIGVFIWKKKNRKGFVPANNLDNDSTYSNNSADQLLTK